jgi:hypothetical protein
MSSFTPQPLCFWERSPVPIKLGLVGTRTRPNALKKREISCTCRVSNLGREKKCFCPRDLYSWWRE